MLLNCLDGNIRVIHQINTVKVASAVEDELGRIDIHNGNLASLDPIWTTAPPTKDYAFLTFDQLLAVDSNYVPHPQMAEGWTVEELQSRSRDQIRIRRIWLCR